MEPQAQAQQMLINTISAYEQGLIDLSDDQLRELVGLAEQAGVPIDVRTDLGRMAKTVINEGLFGLPGLVAGAFGSQMFDPISEAERTAGNVAGLAGMFAGGAGLARTLGRSALKKATGEGARQAAGRVTASVRGGMEAGKASRSAISTARQELDAAEDALQKALARSKKPAQSTLNKLENTVSDKREAFNALRSSTGRDIIRGARGATASAEDLDQIARIQAAIANNPMLARAFQGAVGFGAAGGLRGLSEGDPVGGALSAGAMGALGGAGYGSRLGQSAYGYLKGNPKLSVPAGSLLAMSMMQD